MRRWRRRSRTTLQEGRHHEHAMDSRNPLCDRLLRLLRVARVQVSAAAQHAVAVHLHRRIELAAVDLVDGAVCRTARHTLLLALVSGRIDLGWVGCKVWFTAPPHLLRHLSVTPAPQSPRSQARARMEEAARTLIVVHKI